MRFFYVIVIGDSSTNCYCCHLSNRTLCTIAGLFQLFIVLLSVSQHVYSVVVHGNIFACHSNITLMEATFGELVMAWDIIIFDFGLFNYLLGTTECIANYLDGGYGRCMWCTGHVATLLLMYGVLLSDANQGRPWLLVPVLLHQSIYSLGLMILILATIPKMVVAIGYSATMELFELLVWYIAGSVFTWFFTCVLWHYYWLLDDTLSLRHKQEREEFARKAVDDIKTQYDNTINTCTARRVGKTGGVDYNANQDETECDENSNQQPCYPQSYTQQPLLNQMAYQFVNSIDYTNMGEKTASPHLPPTYCQQGNTTYYFPGYQQQQYTVASYLPNQLYPQQQQQYYVPQPYEQRAAPHLQYRNVYQPI